MHEFLTLAATPGRPDLTPRIAPRKSGKHRLTSEASQIIKRALKERGIQSKDLADTFGVSRRSISFAIQGHGCGPTLKKIKAHLGITDRPANVAPKHTLPGAFSEKVNIALRRKGMTQKLLAAQIGKSPRAVTLALTRNSCPETRRAIAIFLNIPLES